MSDHHVADPPWAYDDPVNARNAKAGAGRRGAEGRYPLMKGWEIDDALLLASGVHGFTISPNAHLYLWVTNSFLLDAFRVMSIWGFTYKTTLTWVKTDGLGMGSYFRNTTEHCLFGVRGRLPVRSKSIPTHILAPRVRVSSGPDRGKVIHSAKPPTFDLDVVSKLSPGPYLEMFARAPRPSPHWGTVGYDFYAPATPSPSPSPPPPGRLIDIL